MKSLKAGVRLKSAVCDAEVMVIKIPAGEYELCCGGKEMLDMGSTRDAAAAAEAGLDAGCLVGKRYVDADDKVELLCTKAGKGTLTLGGQTLNVKQAKALPSSD
jgi:hypothetical protein